MSEIKQEMYLRFPLIRRIQHWTMSSSFIILGITGLIQRYNTSPISKMILQAFGGVEGTRIIHRVAAMALALVTIFHFGDLIYSWYVERQPLVMLPGKEDAINAWKLLRYNLGFEKEEPKQGFFTFEEKLEYWALIWGTLIMGISGFFLWNPIVTANVLPGNWIPAAKMAHGLEAVLAVLAVILWHFYHIFIKHFNKSMYTGYMSKEEMEHYHPLALEGEQYVPPAKDDPAFKKRRTTFLSVYGIFAAVMLGGLYMWLTVETTAIETRPPVPDMVDIEAYATGEAPPEPEYEMPSTVANIGTSWNDGVGEFIVSTCAMCHGSPSGMGGLDLSTYQGALTGGEAGPAVKPGAPGVSPLVLWPQRDDHPVKLDDKFIAALRVWIDDGAPE